MKFRYILLLLLALVLAYVYYRNYYAPQQGTTTDPAGTEVGQDADGSVASDNAGTDEEIAASDASLEENAVTDTTEELILPGVTDREIVEAYKYLNEMRSNPPAYSEIVDFDLSEVQARDSLNWDTILAAVAQTKANDMANRNYFGHVNPEGYGINFYIVDAGYKLEKDWLDNRRDNNFESLAAGYKSGKDAVIGMVNDDGIPTGEEGSGHRMHLLGIDDWHKKMKDIGIGHAYNPDSNYKHYWVFVIARHKW
ncbi:MAG: CAP domain-containing protein [Paludibacteraceae bacterium]|nr:CAP domain-containing protein [Paludibacteraceae bacterium]